MDDSLALWPLVESLDTTQDTNFVSSLPLPPGRTQLHYSVTITLRVFAWHLHFRFLTWFPVHYPQREVRDGPQFRGILGFLVLQIESRCVFFTTSTNLQGFHSDYSRV